MKKERRGKGKVRQEENKNWECQLLGSKY